MATQIHIAIMKKDLTIFEGHGIRRLYDEKTETWWFSVVDIMQVLTQQPDYKAAQNYWKVLKHRLNKEGSQSVTNCNQLKLQAADGKSYLTDVANAETLLRLVQSVPSPKAEPIKLWLAKVGYERMQEMSDPARALERARATWQKHGRSDKWIQQRTTGQETRNKLTAGRIRALPSKTDGARLCRGDQPQQLRASSPVKFTARVRQPVMAAAGRGRHSRAPGQCADAPLADLERACPDVSRDMIRLRLRDLKAAGCSECLGRGPGAKWRKRVTTLKEGKKEGVKSSKQTMNR